MFHHRELSPPKFVQATDENPTSRPSVARRAGYVLVNLWLCYHLFAIIICPASVAPAAPIVRSGWTLASRYLQALYLNHGFHFFAPDPGGSTLVRYTVELTDGTTRGDQIPNRKIWPRLLYHRHFMLTEFLGNGPEEFKPYVERALARNLCRTTGAQRVSLFLVSHDTISIEGILAGKSINDSASYSEIELGSYSRQDLAEAYQPPVLAPAPDPADNSAPAAPESDDDDAVVTHEFVDTENPRSN